MSSISKAALIILAGVTGISLSFSASAAIDLSKLPPPSDKTGLTFTNDIKPLFQATCVRCHGPRQQRGGIRLDSLDDVLQGGDKGPIVTVGDGTNSQLVISISQLDPKTAMPPKRRARGPGGPGGPGGMPPGGVPPGGPDMNAGGPPGGMPPGGPGGPPGEMGTNGPAGGPPRRPAPKPLTPEQVGLVRAWINQGAK